MSEPSLTSLEVVLVRAANALPLPDPDLLAGEVAERLRSQPLATPPPRTPQWRRSWRPLLAVAAAVLVVSVAIGTTVPPVRSALADLLGVDGVHITRVPRLTPPTSPPTSRSATTVPLDPIVALHLGTPTSLQGAARQVGFHVRVPTTAGYQQPDAVLFASPPVGGMASMVYLPGAGRPAVPGEGVAALLSEFHGHLDAGFFQKLIGSGTDVQLVKVSGSEGFWLSGAPHEFFYVNPDGSFATETIRMATNTLVWSAGGITYRLESALSRDAAVAIAVSMR